MLLISGLLAVAGCVNVMAAEAGDIVSYYVGDNSVVLFVANPGEGAEISCQVGNSLPESVTVSSLEESETPVETIILIDNSLSIKKETRPLVTQAVKGIIENRKEGELFTLATFSDKIEYIITESRDYDVVTRLIDTIEYTDQETYLTDVLYDLLKELAEKKDGAFRKIIVISDGVDSKEIGITKEELREEMKNTPVPIFSVGCPTGNNNEELKEMFALSRISGGDSCLLDGNTEPEEIQKAVQEVSDLIKVEIIPKESECNGSTKGVVINTVNGEKKTTGSAEIRMPFRVVQETASTAESTKEVINTAEAPLIEESVSGEAESAEKRTALTKILIAALVLVIVATIAAVIIVKNKDRKEKERFVKAPDPEDGGANENAWVQGDSDSAHTEVIRDSSEPDDQRTMMLWGDDQSKTLVLQDLNDPLKRFEASLDHVVTVGHNSTCRICIDYDATVSREHCSIYSRDGKVYVENLSRTNGTIMDGIKIDGVAELYSGCELKLGRVKLKVNVIE